MRYLVSGNQMKQIDRYTIETVGIPSMVLMERAAMAVAEAVEARAGKKDRIWSVCGTGNNGGDGIAAARILFLKGYDISILLCGNTKHGTRECQQQLSIARQLDIPVMELDQGMPVSCDVIIDALFGVGLSREIEGKHLKLLKQLESCGAREIIAVDIPSGIHSDTGQVMGDALKAQVTVTFGYEKLGTVLYPGKGYSGKVVVKDIGFPAVSCQKSISETEYEFMTYGPEDVRRIPKRQAYSNKGSFGKVLIVAGSKHMSGAAYLSALASYRMGAGLVKILTVEENRIILQEQLPEAVIETYQPELALTDKQKLQETIEQVCAWASVVVAGPGLGQETYVDILMEAVLANAYVPVIIDADGLNTIARCQTLTRYFTENIIITPHLGEMARLTGKSVSEIQKSLISTAVEYSSLHGITCVVKDAVTAVAGKEGTVYLNSAGNSGMAKGGTGDVLTGVIAGLLAQGEENWEAAILGVHLHAMAGDRCRDRIGEHGMLASDIANQLGDLGNMMEAGQ